MPFEKIPPCPSTARRFDPERTAGVTVQNAGTSLRVCLGTRAAGHLGVAVGDRLDVERGSGVDAGKLRVSRGEGYRLFKVGLSGRQIAVGLSMRRFGFVFSGKGDGACHWEPDGNAIIVTFPSFVKPAPGVAE